MNDAGLRRNIVTIGASAGGITPLTALFAKLRPSIPAAIAVVLHRSPVFETRLPAVLGRRSQVPVLEPRDGDLFEPGRIYVAPRDQHLVLEDSRVRLNRGPQEHRTRPAIDPLFSSAARVHGDRVVAILLSGFGQDGVSGLIAVKAGGGISLVQHPEEAQHGAMPRNAILEDDVDGILYVEEIAQAIAAMAEGLPFDGTATLERRAG